MKITLLLILTLFYTTFLNGQTLMSNNTLADLQELVRYRDLNKGVPDEMMLQHFPLVKMNGKYYVSLLVKVSSSFNLKDLNSKEIIIGSTINDIVTIKVPLNKIEDVFTLNGITQLHLAGKIRPTLDKALFDTRVDSVHAGINLPEAFTGKDVMIGITDWGFDYTSPMFYDTTLTQSRIYAAWDQYKTSGPSPAGYSYGTEYTTIPDLIAAGSDTANIYSYHTHGSHVAGIAGGSGAGTKYRGMAFESQFLFVTFIVDEGAVLDAWQWMYDKSQEAGKRLVVNMSWGLYHFDAIDGSAIISQAIDAYSDLGVVFVTSGGNNGDVTFHIAKDFASDTLLSRINFYTSASLPTLWGQSIHAWGESGNNFSTGIKVLNASNQLLVESEWYSTQSTTTYIDSFLVTGTDTVWFNISADEFYPTNNRPQMRLRVRNLNSGLRVVLKAEATSGKVHFWNVTELTNDVGNWGMPFTSLGGGYSTGDKNYGIGTPACTESAIAVAAHNPEYLNTSGYLVGGSMTTFSSYGPTMDERLKPDVSAPGGSIASSISSFTDASFTSIEQVDFMGRTYHFARFSGTSMSSPATAGVCALILDANPFLSSAQVKEILIQTAREDSKTGDIPDTGDVRWGWGKVNAYAAIQYALYTFGTEEIEKQSNWQIYPNPANTTICISGLEKEINEFKIIDLQGNCVLTSNFSELINIENLSSGVYVFRIIRNGKVEQQRFIKY